MYKICICICTCMHVCKYAGICEYTYIYTYVCVCAHVYVYLYIYMHVHPYVHVPCTYTSCGVIRPCGIDEQATAGLSREDERGGSSATSSARLTQCSTEASRSYSPERQRPSGPHRPLPFANLQVGGHELGLRRTDHGKFEHYMKALFA